MEDNKEKDEVEEIFNRAIEIQDEKMIQEQENQEEEEPDTHNIELYAPAIAIVLAGVSIISIMWFTAYFGILFSGIGIYMCRKKNEFLKRSVLLFNVIAFALSFFMGGMWIVLYLTKLMS